MTMSNGKWIAMGVLLLMLAPCVLQAQETTSDAMREDAAQLSPYSPSGAIVRRRPDETCNGFQPFEYLACGPMTSIMLELMPGMYGTLDHTTTQGGQLAQFMDQLMAMSDATDPDTMEELARQEDSQDGSSVSIAIPLIDYGFTGSFGNASISMNRAHKDTHDSNFQAVGPRDAIPGPGFAFPLSGKVTILEYTPWVLRGTFSAAMVDLAESDLSGDDPVLQVVRNISGSFNIIGPWRGDSRAQVEAPENIERSVVQDVGSVLGVTVTDATGTPGQSNPAGQTSSTSSGGSGCDCSCNVANSAAPQCVQLCEATFKACKGEPLAMMTDSQMSASASLDENVAIYSRELRERFEAYLRETHANSPVFNEILSGYLQSYDDSDNLEARITIIATAGMPVDCPAPKEVAERMKMAEFMFCTFYPEQDKEN